MAASVCSLISSLREDPWRSETDFTPEIREASERIWRASETSERERTLNEWLGQHQPCLFGKAAAKNDLLTYCILDEQDLAGSDDDIAKKIQDSRLRWLADAFDGNKSGFVILAAAPTISRATPDETVQALATRLAFLYLQEDIEIDHVHLDTIELRKPGQTEVIWRWDVGVNYFSAQGDGRWWHDHRIPGGLGFSMNSVGHMVRSAKLAAAMKHVEKAVDAPSEPWDASRIDSLEKALGFAMRTIASATATPWGKATELLPAGTNEQEATPKCPFTLPSDLTNNNPCQYRGYYHTDVTLPSEYFSDAVARPEGKAPHQLDFTYLFHSSVDNPAHTTMGTGRRVKADTPSQPTDYRASTTQKERRAWGEEVLLQDCPRLIKALEVRR